MLKVLVVEDERPISNLICLNLKKAGYDCTALYDGKSAADILVDHTFDLILLDIMLPEINGYELMEYIRPMGIPVIFITAKAPNITINKYNIVTPNLNSFWLNCRDIR